MTYDSYVQKIRRRADRIAKTVSWVKKHRVLLAFAFLALAGAVFALMAFSGSFTNRSPSLTVTYGEEVSPESGAFLCGVSYEYLQNGKAVEEARLPGEYTVRAYTKNILGIEREHTFTLTVEPRKAALSLLDPQVEYGAAPDSISVFCGGLVNGDIIAYALLEYTDEPGEQTARLVSLRVEDKNGKDVTNCYLFDLFEPRLTVVPRAVTVTTLSAEKIYDGTPLVCGKYETDKNLAHGDELILAFPSLCEAGETENTPEISVKNGETDVSGYYDLTVVPGIITVKKRPLTLRTASFETEYDGKPHSAREYEIAEGTLVEGHTLAVEWPEDRVNAVSERNKANFTVLDASGGDVTENYELKTEYGEFVIRQRKITLTTESAEFEYDSTPHTFRTVKVTSGELAPGERVNIDAASSFTKVGWYTNTISCRIISSARTTTRNYDITYEDGTVTITKRPLTVLVSIYSYSAKSKSFTVEYTPYNCKTGINDTLYRMGVVSGTTFEDVKRGAKASVFSIMDSNANVTFCYDIDYVFAEYTQEEIEKIIKEAKGDSSSSGSSGNGSGTFAPSYNVPTEAFNPQGLRLGYVRSANSGQMLLRIGCFGDYNYVSGVWSGAVGYGVEKVFDSVYFALANNSFEAYNEVSVHWDNQPIFSAVPYFCPVNDADNDLFVNVKDADGNGNDDFPAHIPTPSLKTLLKVAENYHGKDIDYEKFVQMYYLNVTPELKELMLSLASDAGIEPGDADIYEKVRDCILGAAEYSYNFPSVPAGTDPVVYFLTESKQGVCSHFAAAATLMYRALGVPARYTYGVSVCPYADKKPTPFTDANLHAWVEVYISGFGWIPIDVTPPGSGSSAGEGDDIMTYDRILIIPEHVDKVFDGEPATLAEYTIYGEELLEEGDHVEINASASRTYAGYSVFAGSEVVRIADARGNDVTNKYEVSFLPWDVTVLPLELQADELELYIGQTVSAPGILSMLPESVLDIIDGSDVSVDELKLTDGSCIIKVKDGYRGLFASEQDLTGEIDLGGEDEGSAELTAEDREIIVHRTVKVKGLENVRFHSDPPSGEYYDIPLFVKGENGLEYRHITVISASVSKTFDGGYLSADGCRIICGSLAEGHALEYECISSALYTGSVPNRVSKLRVVDEAGHDVTGEYDIDVFCGTLTVDPGVYVPAENEISLEVDQSAALTEYVWTETVGGVPSSFRLQEDDRVAHVEGEKLIGVRAGETTVTAYIEGADLNGDGVPEYLPAAVTARVTVTEKESAVPDAAVIIIISASVAEGAGMFMVLSAKKRKKKKEKE